MSDSKVFIYGLLDPISKDLRYVGKANDPQKRFQAHLQPGQLNRYRSVKNSWIKSVLAKGFIPNLVILDCIEGRDANEAEKEYINFFRERTRLTNGTDGGDGGAVTDPEARARIRAAHFGSKASEATKKLMSKSAKKRCEDPEFLSVKREAALKAGCQPPVRFGESNNKATLTDLQVREIRERFSEGESRKVLAEKFGVTNATLGNMLNGVTRLEAGGPIQKGKARKKLFDEDVREIKLLIAKGYKQGIVAKKYNVTQSHISDIVAAKKRK